MSVLSREHQQEELVDALRALEEDTIRLQALKRDNAIYFFRPNRPQNHLVWSDSYIRTMFGGNRSGKTTIGIIEDICYLLGFRPYLPEDHPRYYTPFKPPTKVLLISESWEHLQDIHVPKFHEWCPKGWAKELRRQGNVVGFEMIAGPGKGSVLRMATYDQNPKKVEGKDFNAIHFDEPPPYSHFTPLTRGLVDSGGQAWLTMTLLSEGWLWDEIWTRAESGDQDYFAVVGTIYDNVYDPETGSGALKVENIDRFAKGLDDSSRQVRLYGKPQHLQGKIFKAFRPQEPWVVDEYEAPEEWPCLRAFDPHQARPIAGLWARLTRGNRIVITDCMFDEDMPRRMDALREQVRTIERSRKHRVAMSLMDSAGGAEDVNGYSVFDHFRHHGIHCRPAKKANKLARVMRVAEMFEIDPYTNLPQIVIMRNGSTEKLIWEIQRYTHPTFKNKYRDERWKDLREGADKRDDHLIDCLLYLAAEDPKFEYLQEQSMAWYPSEPELSPSPDPFLEHYGGDTDPVADAYGDEGVVDATDHSTY
jgi:hypothetical protein